VEKLRKALEKKVAVFGIEKAKSCRSVNASFSGGCSLNLLISLLWHDGIRETKKLAETDYELLI
jgi:hypothetical protein